MQNIKPPAVIFLGIIVFFCIIFGYFYFFNQFWTHRDPASFKSLVECKKSRFSAYRGRQILFHRQFLNTIDQIHTYAVKHNLHLLITQSLRHPGKKIAGAIVTPAVKSNHLAGHAFDFNIIFRGKVYESKDLVKDNFRHIPVNIVEFIEEIRLNQDIRWGGDFSNQDPVHLDDGLNINNIKIWEDHYKESFNDYIYSTPKWISWIKGRGKN